VGYSPLSLGPHIGLVEKEVEMRSHSLNNKLTSQEIKQGPAKVAWWREEVRFEIERLKAILRDPAATDEEKSITQSQIANYQELSVMAAKPPADWLRQMYLLAS